jgi:hypothetical protein
MELQTEVHSVTNYVDPVRIRWVAPSEQHRLECQGISISGLGKDDCSICLTALRATRKSN